MALPSLSQPLLANSNSLDALLGSSYTYALKAAGLRPAGARSVLMKLIKATWTWLSGFTSLSIWTYLLDCASVRSRGWVCAAMMVPVCEPQLVLRKSNTWNFFLAITLTYNTPTYLWGMLSHPVTLVHFSMTFYHCALTLIELELLGNFLIFLGDSVYWSSFRCCGQR